jgi:hydrogenase-4 component B
MPDLALGLEVAVMAALFALGPAGLARPRLAPAGALACCGVGAMVALGALIAGAAPAEMAVPFGLPGIGMRLGLDGLSALFLLLLFLVGAAAGGAALRDPARSALFPPWLGTMAFTLLAADGFALVLGAAAASVAGFAQLPMPPRAQGVRLYPAITLSATLALLAAVALLAPALPWGVDLGFAAMRAHPPAGGQAALVLLLALMGAGGPAGLLPLHLWLPPAHAAAPPPVAAVMSAAATKVALYVLIRLLFDLAGPIEPVWWGAPLIGLGAVGAVLGMLRATQEDDIASALACAGIGMTGMIAIGLGVALAARASDLPGVATLALGGALLLAVADALAQALLVLGAGAVQAAAGTRRLARLGGLIHRMPLTALAMLAGAASLAGLPPSAGFAGRWTLLEAVLAAPRIGGPGLQLLVVLATAALGLAAALAGVAAVRLIGVGWLGRPRTPRAAAAQEAPLPMRTVLAGLAGLGTLVGLFPAAVLALARPALLRAIGGDLGDRIGPVLITAQAEGPGYAAPAVTLLLVLALLLAWVMARWRAVEGYRTGPAWHDGFAAPPPWLPFGEPLTQYGGASFGQILRRTLGAGLLGAREALDAPAPGETRPARLLVSACDPALALLARPLGRLRRRLSAGAARMQRLGIGAALALTAATLTLLLAALAALGRG